MEIKIKEMKPYLRLWVIYAREMGINLEEYFIYIGEMEIDTREIVTDI